MSCYFYRVSSNTGDSFVSKSMIVYCKHLKNILLHKLTTVTAPPQQVSLSVSTVPASQGMSLMANLSCEVMSAYPQPLTRLVRTTEWGTL